MYCAEQTNLAYHHRAHRIQCSKTYEGSSVVAMIVSLLEETSSAIQKSKYIFYTLGARLETLRRQFLPLSYGQIVDYHVKDDNLSPNSTKKDFYLNKPHCFSLYLCSAQLHCASYFFEVSFSSVT